MHSFERRLWPAPNPLRAIAQSGSWDEAQYLRKTCLWEQPPRVHWSNALRIGEAEVRPGFGGVARFQCVLRQTEWRPFEKHSQLPARFQRSQMTAPGNTSP